MVSSATNLAKISEIEETKIFVEKNEKVPKFTENERHGDIVIKLFRALSLLLFMIS
jgi:hypothetical protein